jgi:uncharacterized protein with GYD domain
MPKFLIRGTYSVEGMRGLQKEGGSSRREAVKAAVESAGGTMETFLYAFGDTDLYVIVDMPDRESMTALAITIGASGALAPQTTPLLTPEQVDEAVKRNVNYRPPGA